MAGIIVRNTGRLIGEVICQAVFLATYARLLALTFGVEPGLVVHVMQQVSSTTPGLTPPQLVSATYHALMHRKGTPQ